LKTLKNFDFFFGKVENIPTFAFQILNNHEERFAPAEL
jgi:hypothetical protein